MTANSDERVLRRSRAVDRMRVRFVGKEAGAGEFCGVQRPNILRGIRDVTKITGAYGLLVGPYTLHCKTCSASRSPCPEADPILDLSRHGNISVNCETQKRLRPVLVCSYMEQPDAIASPSRLIEGLPLH
jgi:hypothetical protein